MINFSISFGRVEITSANLQLRWRIREFGIALPWSSDAVKISKEAINPGTLTAFTNDPTNLEQKNAIQRLICQIQHGDYDRSFLDHCKIDVLAQALTDERINLYKARDFVMKFLVILQKAGEQDSGIINNAEVKKFLFRIIVFKPGTGIFKSDYKKNFLPLVKLAWSMAKPNLSSHGLKAIADRYPYGEMVHLILQSEKANKTTYLAFLNAAISKITARKRGTVVSSKKLAEYISMLTFYYDRYTWNASERCAILASEDCPQEIVRKMAEKSMNADVNRSLLMSHFDKLHYPEEQFGKAASNLSEKDLDALSKKLNFKFTHHKPFFSRIFDLKALGKTAFIELAKQVPGSDAGAAAVISRNVARCAWAPDDVEGILGNKNCTWLAAPIAQCCNNKAALEMIFEAMPEEPAGRTADKKLEPFRQRERIAAEAARKSGLMELLKEFCEKKAEFSRPMVTSEELSGYTELEKALNEADWKIEDLMAIVDDPASSPEYISAIAVLCGGFPFSKSSLELGLKLHAHPNAKNAKGNKPPDIVMVADNAVRGMMDAGKGGTWTSAEFKEMLGRERPALLDTAITRLSDDPEVLNIILSSNGDGNVYVEAFNKLNKDLTGPQLSERILQSNSDRERKACLLHPNMTLPLAKDILVNGNELAAFAVIKHPRFRSGFNSDDLVEAAKKQSEKKIVNAIIDRIDIEKDERSLKTIITCGTLMAKVQAFRKVGHEISPDEMELCALRLSVPPDPDNTSSHPGVTILKDFLPGKKVKPAAAAKLIKALVIKKKFNGGGFGYDPQDGDIGIVVDGIMRRRERDDILRVVNDIDPDLASAIKSRGGWDRGFVSAGA